MAYTDSPAQPQTSAGCPPCPSVTPPHPDLWNEALAAPPTSVWSVLLAGDTAPIVWSRNGALSPWPDSWAPRRGRSLPVGLLTADPGGLSLRTLAWQTPLPPAPMGMGGSTGHVCPRWRPRSGRMTGGDLAVHVCAGELWVEGAPGALALGDPAGGACGPHCASLPLGLTREPGVWVGTGTRTSGLGEPSVGRAAERKANTREAPGSRLDSLQAEPWVEVGGADLAESPSSWPGACFQGL